MGCSRRGDVGPLPETADMGNEPSSPVRHADADALAETILARAGPHVKLGIPLGIGKPNQLVNALYRRVGGASDLSLEIVTALTLEPPTGSNELERRLVEPIADRLFGGYPPLEYARDARRNALPNNVRVIEFYFAPGSRTKVRHSQQNHISTNYSQVARDVAARGVNVTAQLVAPAEVDGAPRLSLGSNPDVSLDFIERSKAQGASPMVVGQVNRRMPFTYGDAEVEPGMFDALLDDPGLDFPLVGPPNERVSLAAHAMGLYASALVRDGGTLQLGIGAVADAIAWALRLRQQAPDGYTAALDALGARERHGALIDGEGGTAPFEAGLYGATEMFVPGYLALHRAGVLRRRVRATEASGQEHEAVLRAAFFLGPRAFYDALCAMDEDERALFRMMRVSSTNRLGEPGDGVGDRAHARFLNSGMMATALGEVASETLDDGRVVSGVGGQFDFVSMAHRLPDARAIMLIPSTRDGRDGVRSNIRWRVGHATVPRHLKDLLVTEYGVADLRGCTDRETIEAVLSVTDARFQGDLVREAQRAGKLPASYRVPDAYRVNHPDRLRQRLAKFQTDGTLPALPFGSDLEPEERVLGRALRRLRRTAKLRAVIQAAKNARAAAHPPARAIPYLERMGLAQPADLRERILQLVVVTALAGEGVL